MRADGIVVQDDTMMYQFQSTLPRGERLSTLKTQRLPICFNPRSHEGSDLLYRNCLFCSVVSIHAPARGATKTIHNIRPHTACFNPRSHEGSDTELLEEKEDEISFNPRSHEGSDCMMYILLILLSLHHLFCECNYHYLCTTYILMLILCNSL